jgi:hypothetical protein
MLSLIILGLAILFALMGIIKYFFGDLLRQTRYPDPVETREENTTFDATPGATKAAQAPGVKKDEPKK